MRLQWHVSPAPGSRMRLLQAALQGAETCIWSWGSCSVVHSYPLAECRDPRTCTNPFGVKGRHISCYPHPSRKSSRQTETKAQNKHTDSTCRQPQGRSGGGVCVAHVGDDGHIARGQADQHPVGHTGGSQGELRPRAGLCHLQGASKLSQLVPATQADHQSSWPASSWPHGRSQGRLWLHAGLLHLQEPSTSSQTWPIPVPS